MNRVATDIFRSRDLSWLSFNGRVLNEADRDSVPLMERIRFLSIYSSNLDEFYRVRIPALMALNKIAAKKQELRQQELLEQINECINRQLNSFGHILREKIIPLLAQNKYQLVYNQPIPGAIHGELKQFFQCNLLGSLRVADMEAEANFFPESNKLYLIFPSPGHAGSLVWVEVPCEAENRFFQVRFNDIEYIVFCDDIIRLFLPAFLGLPSNTKGYSVKITRDADLDLQDEFDGDLAEKIEKQLHRRDMGIATRVLHDPAMPKDWLSQICGHFRLLQAQVTAGGPYHNLRDLSGIQLEGRQLNYPAWPAKQLEPETGESLLDAIQTKEYLIHPPYHSYTAVLRFFNEASVRADVTDIWITLYRVASDSKIATALINAARNGKKVTVFVELKARFDEANNIRWSKRMKEAGVRIIYSIPGLKVHAKIALVRFRSGWQLKYAGILATGNFNERTARFYTDHILFSSRSELMRELELLFHFLTHRRKPVKGVDIEFRELLVAQFNLSEQFEKHIASEIEQAQKGNPALIRIKLNNLEDEKMILLLYKASQAGVRIELLIRGICRLQPGIPGLSELITVKRIVDRYLEHGRIFYFRNNGQPRVFAGSADWMERNLHRRIEVCFPVLNNFHQQELMSLFDLQWADTLQSETENGTQITQAAPAIRSQEAIWKKITGHEN